MLNGIIFKTRQPLCCGHLSIEGVVCVFRRHRRGEATEKAGAPEEERESEDVNPVCVWVSLSLL